MKSFEIYVNGALAARTNNLFFAEKAADKFPSARVEIYQIIETVQTHLVKVRTPGVASWNLNGQF